MFGKQSWARTWCGPILGLAVAVLGARSVSAAEPLQVVTGSDYAPFADEKLPDGGLATALVKRAFAAVHTDVAISVMPWKRGYDGTAKGEYAATFPYVPSEARKQVMLYSDPIVEIRQLVFSAKNNPVPFTGLDDLKGKVVCSALGYALPDAVDAMVKAGDLKREQPANLDACGRLIVAGRADFLIGDVFTAGEMFKRIGAADQVEGSAKPLSTSSLHLIAAKSGAGSQTVIDAFNAGLKAIRANGGYDAVVTASRSGS